MGSSWRMAVIDSPRAIGLSNVSHGNARALFSEMHAARFMSRAPCNKVHACSVSESPQVCQSGGGYSLFTNLICRSGAALGQLSSQHSQESSNGAVQLTDFWGNPRLRSRNSGSAVSVFPCHPRVSERKKAAPGGGFLTDAVHSFRRRYGFRFRVRSRCQVTLPDGERLSGSVRSRRPCSLRLHGWRQPFRCLH